MNGLTVIATNNGFDYLEQSLESEKNFGKWPVVVVDTASNDPTFRDWAESVCKKYNVEYVRMTSPRYDFGAYTTIPQMTEFEYFDAFWFKHDSLYLKSKDFYPIIEKELLNFDMIGWHFFARWGSSFDNEEQRQWLVDNLGSDDYEYGFYGPNVAMTRNVLNKILPDIRNVVVDTKIKQQAMERGWSILAKKNKISIMFLEQYKGDVQSDAYRFFKKATHESGVPRQ